MKTGIHTQIGISFRILVRNLFLLFPMALLSQVQSSVDTTQIRIGEEIQLQLTIEADTTALVLFPEGTSFGALEVIASYPIDTNKVSAKYQLIKKYGLTQFDSGRYVLPSLRVMIDDRAFDTDSVRIEVKDVPVDTTKQKMFDIKPALQVEGPKTNWGFWLWAIAILLFLGGLALIFYNRKKRIAEKQKQLPPYEEAMVSLQQLDAAHYLEENKSKAYYSSLTEIVKRYVDREVDERALESTSDEFIEMLQLHKDSGHLELNNETIKSLDSILKRADLVKFAKMNLNSGQARADRAFIETVINETKEALPEPTEEELQANEAYIAMMAKKQKRKRIAISLGFLLGAVIGFSLVYGYINGFDTLKDRVFGNELRELSETRWYKSEYGVPAVIIETPEILVRANDTVPEELKQVVKSIAIFNEGTLTDPLFVSISTLQLFATDQEIDLNIALDGALQEVEKRGAKNMLVKREDFETESGIKGMRAYGDFYVAVSEKRVLKEKSNYELLLFAQEGGIQTVLVVYQDDEVYAEGIKQRIINSVELEISNTGQKTKEE